MQPGKLADPYRGFSVPYSNAEKPNDHDLITYDGANSQQPRERLLSGLPYHSEDANASHFGTTHMQAVLPLPDPQTGGHHEAHHPAFASVHQLLHPPPYNYDISYSPESSRKRTRSNSGTGNQHQHQHHHRRLDHTMPPSQPIHLGPMDLSGPPPESDILFPMQSDHSGSHLSSNHSYASPMSLSLPLPIPQQHHHHRLPAQANLREKGPQPGPPNMVGQPGMPPPAPRPKGPKLKFTPKEDYLLVELKEEKNLTWKQVADFFPGRSSGTLQVRYCTKLRAKEANWTDEMVEKLRLAVRAYSRDRWRIISTKLGPGYNALACEERAKEFPPEPESDSEEDSE
ncbi:hypothetical protein N7466_009738 [Penicillium verhagenii]|uniref:uncharacterized protein n=1 Tax=Penicillium verhagenii TaxID=1562060 RepID=UPI0025453B2A|nr:uncharacterized protein N7466_009738 [Penicillium verhagenii]KAJ5921412.1 hypothetical protein N7466_009738 [Penicillium verhagenii]